MFDTLFDEINDMPGEIFDVIEYKEEWEKDDRFDVEKHINGDTEFWWQLSLFGSVFRSFCSSLSKTFAT